MDEILLQLELEEEARVLAAVGLVQDDFSDKILSIQSADWLAECEEVNEVLAVELQ
jgi:hypothetical protein